MWSSRNTRSHSMKLHYPDSRVTVRQFFFVRVVQLWNKLPEQVVSASSVSAFISRLNSMHVTFKKIFCFSAVCFFIYLSFRAVVSALWAFLSSRHSSALYCFHSIVSVLINKIFIHWFVHSSERQTNMERHTSCTYIISAVGGAVFR